MFLTCDCGARMCVRACVYVSDVCVVCSHTCVCVRYIALVCISFGRSLNAKDLTTPDKRDIKELSAPFETELRVLFILFCPLIKNRFLLFSFFFFFSLLLFFFVILSYYLFVLWCACSRKRCRASDPTSLSSFRLLSSRDLTCRSPTHPFALP